MDEELSRLARAFAADPSSEALARRYEAALLRAGRRVDVEELYRLKYRCPKSWDDLEATGDEGVRFCVECRREVHRVADEAELAARVRARDCVAYFEARFEGFIDSAVDDPALHAGGERTCYVGTRLDQLDLPRPRDFYGQWAERVVILAEEPGGLVLATDRAPPIDERRLEVILRAPIARIERFPKPEMDAVLERQRPRMTLGIVRRTVDIEQRDGDHTL